MAEAPDGGWGWAIVMATFLTSFLSAGSGFSIGVIYAALLDAFGKSKATTAWVASILAFAMSVSYLLGVASARQIGHRKTVMICGFVTAVGFFSSAFVTELYQLYFTYGVLVGIGCGAPYICCIEMIGHYFKRKLTVALGFGMMGAGAGQLVLSFVCQLLVDNYGWRGMLIIMSAVTANICVAGALLRPWGVNVADPREAISTDSTIEETKSLGINDKKENDDNVKDLASPRLIDIANQSPDEHPSYERKKTLICSCCRASKFKDLLTGSLLFEPVFILQLIVNILQMSGIFSVLVHASQYYMQDTESENRLRHSSLSTNHYIYQHDNNNSSNNNNRSMN
ncbi:monocarboxylate transporter 9-like [Ptychodera flava]|uniref:monocarboxylate transporter 9-like n=1 Tax=Ptychodera flava TaxID=63121 RepID=UPI00396AAA32